MKRRSKLDPFRTVDIRGSSEHELQVVGQLDVRNTTPAQEKVNRHAMLESLMSIAVPPRACSIYRMSDRRWLS